MQRRYFFLLVALFMVLMLSGKGSWQVHVSDIHILFNVHQNR
ncbi:hypothetical protein ACMGGR_20245 [Erwinia sp. BNK-24-b]|nr:hypothetical protein [Erwinia phyllosphaerae]